MRCRKSSNATTNDRDVTIAPLAADARRRVLTLLCSHPVIVPRSGAPSCAGSPGLPTLRTMVDSAQSAARPSISRPDFSQAPRHNSNLESPSSLGHSAPSNQPAAATSPTGNVAMLASAPFGRAVSVLRSVTPRPEIVLEEIPAPKRLAPFAFALSASVQRGAEETASGRFVLLFDPAGQPAWSGTMRFVSFVTAEVESDVLADAAFAATSWAWLRDALAHHDATYTALNGTVTEIQSTTFTESDEEGEFATSSRMTDVELRASWTPLNEQLESHLHSWCQLLADVAGLPPVGITLLRR